MPVTSARQDRVVRVFVSSTFRDMHAERDHLVTVVFPELRERIERLGLEFFDVDLRWGVPARDASGENANSWAYCRQWIERVEPFFVCILGQRYGWVPRLDEFADEADRARQASAPRSITELEVRYAVLDARRKRRSYFYLRDARVPLSPPDAPPEDRARYDEFVDPPEMRDRLDTLKAEVRACGRPVRAYPCRWTGRGFTDLEVFGRSVLEDLWSGVLRDDRYVSPEIWRDVLGADPEADPRYTDECQPVPRELWEQLVSRARPAPDSPLDAERRQMDAFAASRLRWFEGREEELQALGRFANATAADAPRLAVVTAAPGQGKSALLARLYEGLRTLPYAVVAHFVGATERSATSYALVDRLLGELDRRGVSPPAREPVGGQESKRDFQSLCLRLADFLGSYAGERRIVILLDGLNQLSDGHDLGWLPANLGPGVRIVVTCVDDEGTGPQSAARRVMDALGRRRPEWLRVPLGPLTEADVRAIAVAYLREYCHELDTEHLDTLCGIPQARNPLYLMVMLNELRTLGGNDLNRVVPARIASMPRDHPDAVSLFRWVLEHLEVFGADAVRWWCLYLAHGRIGMASHELAQLLARRLGADAAPAALRIERGLRRYLQRRGPQLDFFHGQLHQAVLEEYGTEVEAAAVHADLADYFTACARGEDPRKEWETGNVRGFAECVFHAIRAGQHEVARQRLCSFPFLLHKTRVGMLDGVFEDYELLRQAASAGMAQALEPWSGFFRERAHVLRRGSGTWPAHRILLQLAVEHADDSPLTEGAERWLAEGRCTWSWLRRVPRLPHAQRDPCLAALEGHTRGIRGALVTADGRVVSWAWDSTLRVWDVRSGACLATLEGHVGPANGALALTDGRLLSWGDDRTLRLWDARSGVCLAVLEGHTEPVRGALALADGRLLSWSDDRTLRMWDSSNGVCLATFEGHTNRVRGGLAWPHGRVVSWSDDETLRVWSVPSGACLATLEGHWGPVAGALTLPDGRLLSWSEDGTLRVWDVETGACAAALERHLLPVDGTVPLTDGRLLSFAQDLAPIVSEIRNGAPLVFLEGHARQVRGALVLADGRPVSWADDGTLRVWDAKDGACVARLAGHTGSIRGTLALADGRLVSWADDRTLRVWDAKDGACLATLEGHTDPVDGALEVSGGRVLSWSRERTLRVWDVRGDTRNAILERHAGRVWDARQFPDGRVVSWGDGGTLLVWDARSGACVARLEGHAGGSRGPVILPDGRVVSWGGSTLRLWDGQRDSEPMTLAGHADSVHGALALADGRLVSWSQDRTLRVWDAQGGGCLANLVGHTGPVCGALLMTDGRLVSWAYDRTLRVWDASSGACLATLEGHTHWIWDAGELPDGRLASWSWNGTLLVWDASSGACLAALEGHTGKVLGVLALSDGRLLSWSEDATLRVWDIGTRACLVTLEGHTGMVQGALVLSDGRLLSWSSDGSLRVWDARTGTCLEVVANQDAATRVPEWFFTLAELRDAPRVHDDFLLDYLASTAKVHHRGVRTVVACWDADCDLVSRCLLADGTAVVTQDDGQVCFLKLHHGHHRITLAQAEQLLSLPLRVDVETDVERTGLSHG